MIARTFPKRMADALVPALPFLWLGIFFLAPFLIVLKISLSDPAVAQPPYRPVFEWSDLTGFFSQLDLENFTMLVADDLYLSATLSSIRIAGISTLLLLLVGFPDRLRDGARAGAASRVAGRARHPAVLDELPHPHLRLDRDPEARGLAQPGPDGRWA